MRAGTTRVSHAEEDDHRRKEQVVQQGAADGEPGQVGGAGVEVWGKMPRSP